MRKKRVLKLLAFGFLAAAGLAGAARDEFQDLSVRARQLWQRDARAADAKTTFSSVEVTNSSGALVALLDSDDANDGFGGVGNRKGDPRALMLVSAQDAGQLAVFNNAGKVTFIVDGLGGLIAASGDLAETFPLREKSAPGSVVVIDSENVGGMRLATSPYDRRVAGVIAGANSYKSAITLRAMEPGQGRMPVTLTGTAYCLATNANGPIKAGDLLTTSAVPGHAMKVTDYEAARGAILGKALEDLKGDKGHVLILASLQ